MKRRSVLIAAALAALNLFSDSRDVLAESFSDAEYREHIEKLEKRLPGAGFTIVVERPFVVVGDEAPHIVRQRARGTIRWAVHLLKQDYFAKNPDRILDIWLFKDKESYETNVKRLFDKEPTTPFGYYSSKHRALVMNISTGGGTLVHEIVHPFIESNFEDCPSWFNEGLASLYEHCSERGGRIHGNTNWRLKGLHKAIREEKLGSFADLCSTSTREFYADKNGTNYAQARYLCYYLQQRGLLRKFYHAFRRNADTDPTGYKTLVATLGSPNMDDFQEMWESYMLRLSAS